MSTAKVVTILHPSSAVNNIVNDASGNVAVGNNLTVAGTSTISGNETVTGTLVMGSSFKRNRIINGNMLIDQRNAGASVTQTTSVLYTLDRWSCYGSVASKFTVQQNAGSVTPPAGYTKYLGATSSSAYTVGASEFFFIQQVIEGYNVADLGWGAAGAQSVTLSFWVRSSLTGTFGGTLSNDATNRVYPFTYTISSANTWAAISVTVAGDTSGTWQTGTSGGLVVNFNMGAGATVSGTAGAWSGSTLRAPTGAVSVVGTNGATFYVTGVQLEVGTKATPYEMQIYSDQLVQCQRYYEIGGITAVATNIYQNTCWFKVQKRAAPTLTLVAGGLGGATLSGMNAIDYGGVIAGISGFRQNGASSGAIDAVISVSAEL
jgi:hypothetical protein